MKGRISPRLFAILRDSTERERLRRWLLSNERFTDPAQAKFPATPIPASRISVREENGNG